MINASKPVLKTTETRANRQRKEKQGLEIQLDGNVYLLKLNTVGSDASELSAVL